MFEQIIAYHARVRPDSLAIFAPNRITTFRQFEAQIQHLQGLLSAGAELDGLVAISIADLSDHWCAVFALARLGLATLSLSPPEVVPTERQLDGANVSWVVTDKPINLPPVRTFELRADWRTTEPSRASKANMIGLEGGDIARVTTSSGSTGRPKLIALSKDLLDLRIRNAPLLGPLSGGRLLSLIGIDNWGGFIGPLISWATSGSVIFPGRVGAWAELFTGSRPELLIASPMHLGHIVQNLPSSFVPYGLLRIVVAGGAMPPGLGNVVRAMLTPDVFISYASTECGFSSYGALASFPTTPGAAGFVLPWSEVQIVDDDDAVLPPGSIGTVRTRGAESVSSYYGEPAGGGDFKDGWFYPGDVGSLSEAGLLTILGRVGDVMNCGGVKIAPLPIEDALLRCRGVKDAAAVALQQRDGFDTPFAAIVVGDGYDPVAAKQALAPLRHEIRIVVVDSIPRTPGLAKIMRDELRRKIIEQIPPTPSTAPTLN